jgi:hypothetical protein
MKWIFSRRLDWTAFLAVPAVGFLIYPLIGPQFSFLTAVWWSGILANNSHVFGSLFRIYGDQREFRKFARLYVLLPVFLFLFIFTLQMIAPQGYVETLIAYAAMIHFIRQQYGWMRLSLRNSGVTDSTRLFFTIAVYIFSVVPVVILHMQPEKYWLHPRDLFSIPRFAFLIPILHLITIAMFVAFSIICFWRQKTKFEPSFLIGLSTFVCWYVGITVLSNPFPVVILHAAPYFLLVYRYGANQLTSPSHSRALRQIFAGPLGFLGFYLLLAGSTFFLYPPNGLFMGSLLLTAALFHYITDAIVWRISRPDNKAVTEILDIAS